MKVRIILNNEQIEYEVVLGDLTGNGGMRDLDLLKMIRVLERLDVL